MAKAVIKTTFQLFCRHPGGAWEPQGTWEEVDNFEAMSAAHDADSSGQWDAVRLMSVKTYRDGKAPQETIAWMSPHLTRGGAPTKRGGPPMSSGGGGGDGGGTGGGGGGSTGGPAPQPSAGQDAVPGGGDGGRPRKKKRKSNGGEDLAVAKAGDAYRKIVEQQLGRGAAKPSQKNAISEEDRERAVSTSAVIFRMVTVLLITCLVAYVMTIPIGIVVKGMIKSGSEIPAIIANNVTTAGFLFSFILGWLVIAKILLKPGDVETMLGFVKDMRETEDDDEDEAPSGRGLGLHGWRDEALEDDDEDDFEDGPAEHFQDEPSADFGGAGGAASAGDEDLDYAPDAAPAETRKSMTTFLKAALTAIKDRLAKLDKVGKFGLNLFIAGAGEALADSQGLDGDARNGLITEAIVAIGTKKKMAGKFCDNFDGYARDPKSKALIEAGRAAMTRFVQGDGNAFSDLPAVIDGFSQSRPAKTASATSGVAVFLVTELLGLAEISQQFGDGATHDMIKSHRAVVGNALATYHGRELDNTGDSISAVFSNPANAVGAAMVAQQEFARLGAAAGGMPAKVRMGLNAGPATDPTDAAFRAALQVSSGICQRADAERIYLTQTVRDLLDGQAVQLREVGGFEVRGANGAVTVHEVIWSSHLAAR